MVSTGSWRKIYYYEGRKYSKKEWEQLPDSPRKFYGLDDETIEYFLEHVRADIEHSDASSNLLCIYVSAGMEIAQARRASAATLWAWREMHE